MKKLVRSFCSAFALMAALVLWGCAGDQTHQSTGEMMDNAAITAKVKAALIDDPGVKGMSVNVDTFRGEVQLNGFVETEAQKSRAEDIAAGVDGVKMVKNNLTVKTNVPR
jgi:hyperosmotically inducible protein